MKYKHCFLICCGITLIVMGSCDEPKRQQNQSVLSYTDTVWLDFLSAMQRKDMDYLIRNSLDTIQCGECNLTGEETNEYYQSSFVFEVHLDKLMHLKDFKNSEYSISEDDGELRISYSVQSRYAEEGGYNLIFLFLKADKGYLFKGMFVT